MQHKIFPALLAASIVALTAAPATALEHGDPATDFPEARTVAHGDAVFACKGRSAQHQAHRGSGQQSETCVHGFPLP